MGAGGRLAAYGAGLVVALGASYGIAAAVVPDELVDRWSEQAEPAHAQEHAGAPTHTEDSGGHGEGHGPTGVSLDADGLRLSPVSAPHDVDSDGVLSFRILDPGGAPLTDYTEAHEQDLHLIVVRTDGVGYQHVHPRLDSTTGTWSLPWTWEDAGTYRVYADFTPGTDAAQGITLTRTVDVAGEYAPATARPARTDEVDGYSVSIDGELRPGSSSDLRVSVERGGRPVTDVQPYLGAFGHLVALRQGDLAYLHVHATGDEPAEGDTTGPDIGFAAEAPTAGRYLMYLDFRVDGEVRTARFVLDAGPSDAATTDHDH